MIMAETSPDIDANEDHREFLAACGRFAVVTPPSITVLLSTSLYSTAVTHSGGYSHKLGYSQWYPQKLGLNDIWSGQR
jgi:hypothetical protein